MRARDVIVRRGLLESCLCLHQVRDRNLDIFGPIMPQGRRETPLFGITVILRLKYYKPGVLAI